MLFEYVGGLFIEVAKSNSCELAAVTVFEPSKGVSDQDFSAFWFREAKDAGRNCGDRNVGDF